MNVPDEWAELPGTIDIQVGSNASDYFTRNLTPIVVTHRMPATEHIAARKVAGWIAATPELLADAGMAAAISGHLARGVDRHIRPWAYPDRPVVWAFDLFPRWTRLTAMVRRIFRRGDR